MEFFSETSHLGPHSRYSIRNSPPTTRMFACSLGKKEGRPETKNPEISFYNNGLCFSENLHPKFADRFHSEL